MAGEYFDPLGDLDFADQIDSGKSKIFDQEDVIPKL